jgi:hypothetical protein
MSLSPGGGVSFIRGRPTVFTRIISATGVHVVGTPPDDHFAAGPNCCVTISGRRRICNAGSGPAICARVISSAGVRRLAVEGSEAGEAAPDDHFIAGPHGRMFASRIRCVRRAGSYPTIRARIVSAARIEKVSDDASSPNNHFTPSPDCRMRTSGSRCIGGRRRRPTVRAGIVSAAGIKS